MAKKAKILYVEDDLTLSYVTRDSLESRGYEVDSCEDGLKALEMVTSTAYDLCILDVMLPKMDGFTLASKIREKNEGIPILFLTARSTKEDRITGLRIGGDDYITKPYSMEELILKIEVFLRRRAIIGVPAQGGSYIRLGRLQFDPGNQQLMDGMKTIPLTHRESELLVFFASRPGQLIRREDLLTEVWGSDHFFASRSLDVFISRLRKILKTEPGIIIENVHNTGYRFKTGDPA